MDMLVLGDNLHILMQELFAYVNAWGLFHKVVLGDHLPMSMYQFIYIC